jgi:nucleoid-associated protein YgaU
MSINITVDQGAPPSPQFVPPQEVARRAKENGKSDPDRAAAFTVPHIRIDLAQLHYTARVNSGAQQYSFDNTGTIGLALWQEMLVANDLPPGARRRWITHEKIHVADNQALMAGMPKTILSDPTVSSVLTQTGWHSQHEMQFLAGVNGKIFNAIAAIFRQLTGTKATARDTFSEYQTINRDILWNCPEDYIYQVRRGDTLHGLANYYFGIPNAWRTIYQANLQVIGPIPQLVVGQQLKLPHNPF